MLQRNAGRRPRGVRRVEDVEGAKALLAPTLASTGHRSIAEALKRSAALYVELRDGRAARVAGQGHARPAPGFHRRQAAARMTVVTRFAPSPTGELHLGSAFSAWTAWHRAREAGGRFLVRIEDIDIRRCKREFETAMLDDLRWLGFEWDGEVRRQSEHFADYGKVLDQLDGRGSDLSVLLQPR